MQPKINFGYISGYVSEDTGDIIYNHHPSILLITNENKYVFPFTSEELYSVKKEDIETHKIVTDNKYSIELSTIMNKLYNNGEVSSLTKMIDSAIRTKEDLTLARDYYKSIGDEFTADKIHIGSKCKHPVMHHKSYLAEIVPRLPLESKLDVKTAFLKTANNIPKEEVAYNKEFFKKALIIVENAFIQDKIKPYDSDTKEVENFLSLEIKSFKPEERLNIAYELYNKRMDIEHNEKMSKAEYIDKIESSFNLKDKIEAQEFLTVKIETKLDAIYEKMDKLESKITALETKAFKEGLRDNFGNYKALKNEISKEENKLNKTEIILEAYKDKLKTVEKDADNMLEKLENTEKEVNDKAENATLDDLFKKFNR